MPGHGDTFDSHLPKERGIIMLFDIRYDTAQYYDTQPSPFDDIRFYRDHLPVPNARVLELGCGTGRVLIPLSADCRYICGIDNSEAMLSICREKLRTAGIPPEQTGVVLGNITDFDIGQVFDFITAPFRVMQNLATDAEVDGLFRCIGQHLAPGGMCILNVFRPNRERARMLTEWCRQEERLNYELPVEGGRITRHDRLPRLQADPLVLFPELIYRRYAGEQLVEEAVLKFPMRCYYPDEFRQLIIDHGFRITGSWGGYAGENYGEGPELVVAFTDK